MTHKERFIEQLLKHHGPKDQWVSYYVRMQCVEKVFKQIEQWANSVGGLMVMDSVARFEGTVHLYIGHNRIDLLLNTSYPQWRINMMSDLDREEFVLDATRETWHRANDALADEVEVEPVDEERFFESLYYLMGFPGEQTLEDEAAEEA
jgi:hypothetical protein